MAVNDVKEKNEPPLWALLLIMVGLPIIALGGVALLKLLSF